VVQTYRALRVSAGFSVGLFAPAVGPLERASAWSNCARSRTATHTGKSKTDYESLGVDTPEDLERVLAALRSFHDAGVN